MIGLSTIFLPEFQKLRSKLRRSTSKVLLCERVEQLCVRLIVEPIFSGTRDLTGVKIVVWQGRLASAHLAKQLPVAIQGSVEAGFKHALCLRGRRSELQHFQRTDLRDNPRQKGEKFVASGGRLIILAPT